MNESWAIGLPAQSLIGTRVRLVISSVSVPLKPGSTKPAVACTIRPRRPSELLPSMRATMSPGSSTCSAVTPSTNSPGWITNISLVTSSVRFVGGSRRSIAVVRWLWKTRNESPSRRSTEAGWTSSGSHGSITILPSSTRRRIVPSESTDVGIAAILTGGGDSVRAMDLEQLRRDGYTVVEGVAGPEQIEPLLALAQEASGVVLDDPSTWDPDAPELL